MTPVADVETLAEQTVLKTLSRTDLVTRLTHSQHGHNTRAKLLAFPFLHPLTGFLQHSVVGTEEL